MRRRSAVSAIAWSILTVTLALVATSCSEADIRFVDQGASYSFDETERLAESAELPEFAGRPTEEAAELRHRQLVALRSAGSQGAELAELLTDQFPGENRSVPFYAEAASVDGSPAWLVVEVWGPEGETLKSTRLWVFERASGRVMLSASFNR